MDKATVCNFALAKCGEQRIISMTDDSKNAILCRLHFDQTYREVLRNHPWNFAIRRATLAEISGYTGIEFEHQYQLPADCMRVLRLDSDDTSVFNVEGRTIVTDETPCNIVYIGMDDNLNLCDPLFIKVLALELAVKLSYNLTETRTQTDGLLEEAKLAWVEARSMDAQEGTPRKVELSEWLSARIEGTSIYPGDVPFRNISP